ncbi:MAG: hypothetical protein JOZ00_08975 [Mycobacterium sp.]|uniref:hypothetical protein n=1 Tax=Mycobacterium sp. TaxID=1785 RepID=UPI001EBB150A|nr:hypothetical protein [Mycobacterium sp.]MBV8786806.1 hypothetical protein [Mycobacterium sp.]
MADRLDVAERLAEGRLAVEHTQTYVRACQAVGYQHPDLTAHPSRILEWFDSEEGLDLRVLDGDCAELRAAGDAVAEALRVQRAQVAELTAAWTGPGGDAAARVLQRHCDSANAVVTELRAAAQRCESLRDNVWYLVDSKVATAVAVDDRAHQPEWLPAAVAVTTGAGDRQSAEEVVRQQVIPYVDNDIRDDWLPVMRSTSDGVETSYGMVIDRMAAAPTVCFELRGDLGPGYAPLQPAPVSAPNLASPPSPPATAEPPAPADAPAPAVDPAPTLAAAAPPAAAASPAPASDWGTALGDAAGMPAGDLGGGTGGGGGGLLGLAGRIVDAMSDLIGSATDDLGDADAFEGDDPFGEDPFQAEDATDDKPDESVEPDAVKDVDDTEQSKQGAAPVDAPAPPDVPAPIEPPLPTDPPAPVAAPAAAQPAPEPAPGGSTPCEIAADQLPQAGQ